MIMVVVAVVGELVVVAVRVAVGMVVLAAVVGGGRSDGALLIMINEFIQLSIHLNE